MNQIWWEEDPDLVKPISGEIMGLVKLASLRLASHERNIRAGDAKIIQLTGGELAEFIDGVAVTAPVVVRAKQVHRAIPSSLRNWSSVQFISFVAHDISYCFRRLQTRVCIAALRVLHVTLNRLDWSGTKLPQSDLIRYLLAMRFPIRSQAFKGCDSDYW